MDQPDEADTQRAPHALSPEYELLLACTRSRMDERHAVIIRQGVRSGPDWGALLALGRRHSVFPLLYRQLAAVAPHEVPPEHLHRLKELYQANAARNLFLMGELERVLLALAEDGVTAIPYKGPVLALAGYGDLSLRRFVDLDIIVRKSDVEQAMGALRRVGYRPEALGSPSQQALLLRTQHNLAFKREEGRLIVELHWQVSGPRYAAELAAEDLWGRTASQSVGGSQVRILAPEDMLLALCVHGASHVWERLAWIGDIAEWLAAHPDLNWPEILARAERTGQQRMLFAGLRLAADLLDAPLPAEATTAIEADRAAVVRLAAEARRVIFREPPRPPGMMATVRFNLLARRSWAGKLKYLRHLLTPTDADVHAFRAPRALHFAYYVARPFRLLAKRTHLD